MTTKLALPVARDVHVFARSPAEMEAAQHQMIVWCNAKIRQTLMDAREAHDNWQVAKKAKWRSAPWRSRLTRVLAKTRYYRKIRAALRAGYYIIPPFPGAQIFAIRTDQKQPKGNWTEARWNEHRQSSRALGVGSGRYVDPVPLVAHRDFPEKDRDGNEKMVTHSCPVEFDTVDFPVKIVKPEILDATQKAMALKVFDQMGILPAHTAADPIVVGQIKRPNAPSYTEPVTFFVGWWLSTEDL